MNFCHFRRKRWRDLSSKLEVACALVIRKLWRIMFHFHLWTSFFGFTLYDYIVEILVLYLHIEVDRNSIEHQIHVIWVWGCDICSEISLFYLTNLIQFEAHLHTEGLHFQFQGFGSMQPWEFSCCYYTFCGRRRGKRRGGLGGCLW